MKDLRESRSLMPDIWCEGNGNSDLQQLCFCKTELKTQGVGRLADHETYGANPYLSPLIYKEVYKEVVMRIEEEVGDPCVIDYLSGHNDCCGHGYGEDIPTDGTDDLDGDGSGGDFGFGYTNFEGRGHVWSENSSFGGYGNGDSCGRGDGDCFGY